MQCRRCDVVKLAKEFPEAPPSRSCAHPAHFCLKCMVNLLKDCETVGVQKCPTPGCKQEVLAGELIEEYTEELRYLFPAPSPVLPGPTGSSEQEPFIIAMLLNGHHHNIPFAENRTITQTKRDIQDALGHEASKQRLFFGKRELQDKLHHGQRATLGLYHVTAGSTIYVMIQRYKITSGIENPVFDISWGYPRRGYDFLDATAFFFRDEDKDSPKICDYHRCNQKPFSPNSSVCHSGDEMDRKNKKGHHRITIFFQQLPREITTVFFVLSAWKSPTIASFNGATLAFYDDQAEGKPPLCENHVAHLPNTQAIVMCRVQKDDTGFWDIFNMGTPCCGNAKEYNPIIKYLQEHLESMPLIH